jgi:predicted DNA-binding transcriptional regulator AlpA
MTQRQNTIHGGTRTRAVLIDERDAADLIGLTPRFLQERRRTGDGPPFVRISSRCIRYRPSDIEAWAEDRLRTSTSDADAA